MTLFISKNVPSLMAMTLGMVSMIAPADAQTSSTICDSSSPECCWVVLSWQKMGKTYQSSVSSPSRTACCNTIVSSNGKTTQNIGIPGVTCTSAGIVTEINWMSQGLNGSIPTSLGNLPNLQSL